MLYDGKIWVATDSSHKPVFLLPQMANRHGLIAGATGTGKTVTLKVMREVLPLLHIRFLRLVEIMRKFSVRS